MTTAFDQIQTHLQTGSHTWLVTGVAGFIGSNLLEALLKLNQCVVGLDDFATGHQRNLDEVQALVTPEQWANFNFNAGDICKLADCQNAAQGVDYILHQAALGSVPRSVADPIITNITGFLNKLVAARDAKVERFIYAASSSTYGDHPALPKVEDTAEAINQVYNVAVGERTTLNELYALLKANLLPLYAHLADAKPVYRNFRAGDVRHSLADISKAATRLGYAPS